MNKSLTLGVVTTLALSGGETNAASCPTTLETISTFEITFPQGCTDLGIDFTGFDFFHTSRTDLIVFASEPDLEIVTLTGPSGGHLSDLKPAQFGYTATRTSGRAIEGAVAGSQGSPHFLSGVIVAVDELAPTPGHLGTLAIAGGAGAQIFGPPHSSVTSLTVVNSSRGEPLKSISNDFLRGVPEPATLGLLILGLLGAGFAGRKRPN